MGKLDLKDVYLSVPLDYHDRRYMAFKWKGEMWKFKVLPFGLCSTPYIFTKFIKPIVSILRSTGIRIVLYLDDMITIAESKEEAK